jgi:transposase-like protein
MSKRTVDVDLSELRGARAWTEEEGRRVVEAWKASQETVHAFARRTGLVADRVYRWRRRLGAEATGEGPGGRGATAFLPVIVRERSSVGASSGAAVTLCTREGLRVEVAALDAGSAAWVATLMRALGEVRS